MRRHGILVALIGAIVFAAGGVGAGAMTTPASSSASCRPGFKPAIIGGNFKCLKVGQRCLSRYQASYRKYGFTCTRGRLRKKTSVPPAPPPPRAGRVVMDFDLGWLPVPPANLPWNDVNQLILFNLATEAGPGLDAANLVGVNVLPGFKMFTLIPASRRSSRSAGQATTTGGSPATTPTAPSSSRTWSGSPRPTSSTVWISTLRTGRCQRSGRPPR